MKKVISIFLLLIMATLVFVSCRSTPEAVETDALNEAMGKAQAARQRAIDFESPAYFPSDWEAIETRYTQASEMPVSSAEEVQQATSIYNTLADDYDELFGRTIPLYAQAREDEILSTRETLIGTGFTSVFPAFLKKADDLALAAHEQFEANQFYPARETAAAALSEYETLLVGARVYLARQEIIDRGFVDFDRDNFLMVEEIIKTGLENYEAGNRAAAIANAEEALLRYSVVLGNGWTAFASERRTAVSSERETALAERVNVASRELFRAAETILNRAEEEFLLGNFNEAALHFIDAEANFAIARLDTEERRQRAEAVIRMAEERIEESNEAAIGAERIIEGGLR
jgi:hypothetical protein